MKSWFSIENKGNGVADISLHDEIGYWGVSAADFINELKACGDVTSINLSIHSPGGNMLDGFAMHNALKAHPATIYSHVTGIAASAASTVLMAGDVITMPEDGFIMIHNPSGAVYGSSEDMRGYADVMDKLKGTAVNIYTRKTGKTDKEISDMLDAETWLSSDEALKNGFIDTITDKVGAANKANFSNHFKKMPFDSSNNTEQVREIATIKDFERFLRDSGGISRGLATALSSRAKELFQGEPESHDSTALQGISAALARMKIPETL